MEEKVQIIKLHLETDRDHKEEPLLIEICLPKEEEEVSIELLLEWEEEEETHHHSVDSILGSQAGEQTLGIT